MKKLFTLVALVVTILSYNGVFAQCTINTNDATPGFTPTTASAAQNSAVAQTVLVYVPGSISTYTIDSLVVTGITGLPTGLSVSLNPVSGHIITSTCGGNGEGCFYVSGTSSDTVGAYKLTFAGNIYISGLGGLPISAVASQDPGFGFTIHLTAGPPPASCDTLISLTSATDTLTYYGYQSPAVGYISGSGAITDGTNFYSAVSIAQPFSAGIGDTVTAAGVFFAKTIIKAADSAKTVKVYVYDNTGTGGFGDAGAPGAALDSATITLAQAAVSATQGSPALVQFPGAALTTTTFFIAVNLPTTTGDSLVVITDLIGQEGKGYAEYTGVGWAPYDSIVGDHAGNYMVASVCGTAFAPVAAFTQSTTNLCAPSAINFTDVSTEGPTSWSWSFGDGSTSTSQNPTHTFTTSGTYQVVETVTNATGSSSDTASVTIKATPSVTVYVTNASTISSSNGAAGVVVTGGTGSYTYSWSNSTNTTDTLSSLVPGTYYVTVTDANTCRKVDTAVVSYGTGINTLAASVHVKIYPNPANDQLNFEWNINDEAELSVYDVTGRAIKTYNVNGNVSTLDIHEFASGLYVIRVTDKANNQQQSLTFTKF